MTSFLLFGVSSQWKNETLEPRTNNIKWVHRSDGGESRDGAGGGVFPLPVRHHRKNT